MGADAPGEIIDLFGYKSGRVVDKFEGFDVQTDEAGNPYVKDHALARKVIRQGALAVAVLGIFALAVMELLAPFIPRWLGAEPEVYPLAVTDLRMYCLGRPFATALAVFFTTGSYPRIMAFFRRQLGTRLDRARGVKANLLSTLGKWFRAQAILLGVTFCELLAGFLLMGQRYALLLAAVTALVLSLIHI